MRTPSAFPGPLAAHAASFALLFTPALILAAAAAHYRSGLLAGGALAEWLGGLLFIRCREAWRPPASGSVILLHLMALGWLWFTTHAAPDGFTHFGQGLFLLTAVGLVIGHDLIRTGLGPRREAARLARKLAMRTRWPMDLAGYHELPDIVSLRHASRDEPGPALGMLTDPRAEVRIAALLALQGRENWRAGEAAVVLTTVRKAAVPAVRAAGLAALGSSHDPAIVTAIAGFLRDSSAEVRRAAMAALMAGGGVHWSLARDRVRDALADASLSADGPLPGAADWLLPAVVADLTAWSAENGSLGDRAVRTLIAHYSVALRSGDRPELAAELAQQVIDPQTPTPVRVDLASLLRELGMIPHGLLDRLTDADQPGPIRLLAAEILLSVNRDDPDAVDVLRGLGRQSNREMALAIARLLQGYLGLDMGLPKEPVAPNSKAAAETARAVFQWATGRPAPPPPAEAGSAWVTNPVTRPALPTLVPAAPAPRTQPGEPSPSTSGWDQR